MNEFESVWTSLSQSFVQNGLNPRQAGFKMVAIIKFSQIELVWDRVRVESEYFWVNLREDNKVSESRMAVSESNMAEFKIATYHQVESEWMSEVFLCKCLN